jgi:molybdopterin synthase catalytic subunit
MQLLSVIGPSESGKTTLVEQLTERLSDRGPVGTIKHVDCAPDIDTDGKDTDRHSGAGAVETYGISDDEWFAHGESLTLDDALERLGPSCEYALVEGYSDAALPTVALGGRESTAGEVIARGETAEDVDVDQVIERLEETEPHETLSSLVARAKESPEQDKSGAIATFTGRVREKEHDDDEPTELLEFEKYDGVAEGKMATIREELEAREGVFEVLLHHKTGVVEAGEDIVFVVVLAGHRGEAFRTVQDGIDRLKEEVPLFKKEVTVEEEFWAHQT